MKRLWLLVAAGGLALLAAGCSDIKLFEDVGSDPHPPTIDVLGIAFQPMDTGEGTPLPVFFPPNNFVVQMNKPSESNLMLKLSFTDLGGDVRVFRLRDREGALFGEGVPEPPSTDADGDGQPDSTAPPDYFPGTSGIIYLKDIAFTPHQAGPHHVEAWAEDSHDSRSPKRTFTVIAEF